jgi:uncharacterized membrane protein YecN with MAPEG domain
MTYPAVTALYAAILGLIFALLSFWVVGGRGQFRVLHGDGGREPLHRRIRAHANFAEFVPLILILAALLEAGGAPSARIHGLLAPLTIARLMHPVGMLARENSPQQYIFRASGAVVTLIALVTASIMLLMRALAE